MTILFTSLLILIPLVEIACLIYVFCTVTPSTSTEK